MRAKARPGILLLGVLSAPLFSGAAAAEVAGAPKLTFYPALNLRFQAAESKNYFLSQVGVVNASGAPMTELTLRQRFPEGFTARLVGSDQQSFFKRPEGFRETLDDNVYTITLPELRVAEQTILAVELSYDGRPASVTFPGVEVAYSQSGAQISEKGSDSTWDLSRYTRYSGTLRDFVKRFAMMELRIPNESEDWGFTGQALRTAGRAEQGPLEIDTDQSGRLRFSLQAGTPGSLRNFVVLRRPFDPSRQPKANDEVRRLVLDSVQSSADFTLDPDNMAIEKGKVGRMNAWIARTRWRDRFKDRLGEGPSTWYLFADERAGHLYVIHLSAQGRGAGPGRCDVPSPEKEVELMTQLEGMVASIRLL